MNTRDIRFGTIKCSTQSILQQIDEIRTLLTNKSMQPRLILTMNAHIFNMAYEDDDLRRIMNSARMITADGMAIVWASRLFKKRIQSRCNATEAFRAFLYDETIPTNKGLLIGCSNHEVLTAKKNIEAISGHCSITAAIDGFQSDEAYGLIFKRHQNVDFIFLGMGTPKTEIIGKLASTLCPNAIVWGIGGGTIRIFSNTMKEAPPIFRRAGLQWVFRLFSDPIRLWKRYLLGNPLFIFRIIRIYIKEKLKRQCFSASNPVG